MKSLQTGRRRRKAWYVCQERKKEESLSEVNHTSTEHSLAVTSLRVRPRSLGRDRSRLEVALRVALCGLELRVTRRARREHAPMFAEIVTRALVLSRVCELGCCAAADSLRPRTACRC